MTKWRYFAARELPRVIRELGIPCAEPLRVTGMTRCPRHQKPLGSVTRMCLDCNNEAWAEIGRRYQKAGNPARKETPMQHEPQPTGTQAELVPLEGEPLDPELDFAPSTLFHTSDPDVALERMSRIAKRLVDVVDDRHLYVDIRGHKHVTAEGWTTLGGMVGVVPVVVWTKPNETGDGILARVEARTLDGRIVGAAESECSRAETRWKNADAYAIRSMAQTRAIGRALRAPLGQIVVLAGYEPAGAEEIPVDEPAAEPDRGKLPPEHRPTREQITRIGELLVELNEQDPGTDWHARARELAGAPGNMVTRTVADRVILELEQLVADDEAA